MRIYIVKGSTYVKEQSRRILSVGKSFIHVSEKDSNIIITEFEASKPKLKVEDREVAIQCSNPVLIKASNILPKDGKGETRAMGWKPPWLLLGTRITSYSVHCTGTYLKALKALYKIKS